MEFLRVLPLEALQAMDMNGQSPLYMASALGMEGLSRGILLRIVEVAGPNSEHHLNSRDLSGQTVLGASIRGGCSLHYIKFLIEGGVKVNPHSLKQLPWTPLQAAVLSGSLGLVSLLLDKGAKIGHIYPGNDTALVMAMNGGHTEIERRLSAAVPSSPSRAFGQGWNPG